MNEIDVLDIKEIDINEITPNKDQPRKNFDKETINALARSIEKHGIIQPIIVRKKENHYEIIAGERRWRASKSIGLRKVPVVVRVLDDLEVSQIALVENIQRENLNPIEEAIAFKSLIEEYSFTQEKIAEVLGKSRSYVANIIRLINLDERVKDLIIENKLTSGHGRTILGLNKDKEQIDLANMILEKNLSVRETEELVRKLNKGEIKKVNQETQDYAINEVEENLRLVLGTKVQIKSGRDKGKIEIEYYSEEELERIIELIKK